MGYARLKEIVTQLTAKILDNGCNKRVYNIVSYFFGSSINRWMKIGCKRCFRVPEIVGCTFRERETYKISTKNKFIENIFIENNADESDKVPN